jgi:hypothetical protein
MNKRRLLKLADLLEADAKNKKGVKFDLGTWASPSGDSWNRQWNTKEDEIKVDCGTTACAVGLACISGAFARSGLTYTYKPSWMGGFHLIPKFDGSKEFPAVAKFFGVEKSEALWLFSAEQYPDNKTTGAAGERFVAKRIRDFVAGKVSAV